jgi:hypothetical protein
MSKTNKDMPRGFVGVGFISQTGPKGFMARIGVLRERRGPQEGRIIQPIAFGELHSSVGEAKTELIELCRQYRPFKVCVVPIPYTGQTAIMYYKELRGSSQAPKLPEVAENLPSETRAKKPIEYVAFIKTNKNGRMRGVMGKLLAVDGPDADKFIQILGVSELFEAHQLSQAIADLQETIDGCGQPMFKTCFTPVKGSGIGFWESMLKEPEVH